MNDKFKHIEDKTLNIYIINQDLLSKEIGEYIKIHLNECESCLNYYNELKEFHKALKENLQSENILIPDRNDDYREENNIFLMKSLNFFEPDRSDNIKLAAMNKDVNNSPYTYINTYASARRYVMMRVLKNNETDEFFLYLLCDDMEKVSNALISFQGIDKYFVADKNGKIILPSNYFIDNLDFMVYIPIARFILTQENEKINYKSQDYEIDLNYTIKEKELKASFSYVKGKPYEGVKISVINSKSLNNSEIIDTDNFEFSINKENISDYREIILYESN
jgi:hypothetical protein